MDRTKFGTYSLINVSKECGCFVDGVWIQDHSGTLKSAIQKANETEKANGNKITVAVVESILGGSPNYALRTGLRRLG